MTVAIVVFPPAAGGNHLRNLISLSSKYNTAPSDAIYQSSRGAVHATPGSNLQKEQANNLDDTNDYLLHGHFGEIMSYRHQIKKIKNKKFIIICLENNEDRQLLNKRPTPSKYSPFTSQDYFFGEQVFLYEPFIYHHYFNTPMDDIMNIPITEWFVKDITPILARINYFLQIDIDVNKAQELHEIWYKNNLV